MVIFQFGRWAQVCHQEMDGLGPFEVVCGLVERFSSVSSWIDFDFYS